MASKPRSPRQKWKDAFRASDLHPHARLVAFVYAEFCHRDDMQAQNVWVNHSTLIAETGLSTNSAAKYRAMLVDLGWLTETEPHAGKRAARYALTIPLVRASMVETQAGDLESQRLRLKSLRGHSKPEALASEGLSLNPEQLESHSESSRASMVETKSGKNPEDPGDTSGLRGNSPRARVDDKDIDPSLPFDDPWFASQLLDEPPPGTFDFLAITPAGPEPITTWPEPVITSNGVGEPDKCLRCKWLSMYGHAPRCPAEAEA